MTNKEIRDSVVNFSIENGVGTEILNGVINKIQDLTRKDERATVIKEIEEIVKGYMFKATTDNAEKAINRHYGNILAELNQLNKS